MFTHSLQNKFWYLATLLISVIFLASCTKPKPIIIIPQAKKPEKISIESCVVQMQNGADSTKTLDLYPGDGINFNDQGEVVLDENGKEDLSKRIKLVVRPTPLDAGLDDLVWETNSSNIEIDAKTGEIKVPKTAIPENTATVSVSLPEPNAQGEKVTDSCTITIRNKAVFVNSIDIFNEKGENSTNKKIQVERNKNYQLIAIGSNSSGLANSTEILWSVAAGANGVTVNEKTGLVSISGSATLNKEVILTAKSKADSNVSATVKIEPIANIKVDQVLVDHPIVNFVAGIESSQDIFVAVRPNDAFNLALQEPSLSSTQGTGISVSKISDNKYKISATSATKIGDSHTITFESKENSSKTATVRVNIIQKPVKVTAISMDKTQAQVNASPLLINSSNYGFPDTRREQMDLKIRIEPANATNKNILWSSSDQNIVKVGDGHLQAVGVGTAVITATSQSNTDLKIERTVTVVEGVKVTELKPIEYSEGFILYGEDPSQEKPRLVAKIVPEDATNKKVTWISTDPSVITLSENADSSYTINTKGQGGKTVIIAVTQDGKKVQKLTINTASLGFASAKFSPPISVPVGANNTSTQLNQSFSMAKTELVFSLWKEVYDFAVTKKKVGGALVNQRIDGGAIYTFKSTGNIGNKNPSASYSHPVASLGYEDALVFCNAMTEYYNYKKKLTGANKLAPYYLISNQPIRDANAYKTANIRENSVNNKGFRLPTEAEWELMARLTTETHSGYALPSRTAIVNGKSYNFLKNTRASGERNQVIAAKVAWYKANSAQTGSQYSAYPVASLKPNDMGLFDMSGNISEWIYGVGTFGSDNTNVVYQKGGRYDSAIVKTGSEPTPIIGPTADVLRNEQLIAVGAKKAEALSSSEMPRYNIGIRLVRNIDNN